jgi:hypothetical protein
MSCDDSCTQCTTGLMTCWTFCELSSKLSFGCSVRLHSADAVTHGHTQLLPRDNICQVNSQLNSRVPLATTQLGKLHLPSTEGLCREVVARCSMQPLFSGGNTGICQHSFTHCMFAVVCTANGLPLNTSVTMPWFNAPCTKQICQLSSAQLGEVCML